jgi:hypothetical protein
MQRNIDALRAANDNNNKTMKGSNTNSPVVVDEEEFKPDEICEYVRFNSSNVSDSTVDDELEGLVDKKLSNGGERKKQANDDELFLWNTQWLPDGPWRIGKVQLLDYPSVKLFKFFFVTIGMILIVHYYAIVAVSQVLCQRIYHCLFLR